MVNKCPKCEKENNGWKFCSDCGTEFKEKQKPRTLEEALDIWAHDPENMKRLGNTLKIFLNLPNHIRHTIRQLLTAEQTAQHLRAQTIKTAYQHSIIQKVQMALLP